MILDILAGAFILFLMISGWRNGFFRSVFGLVGVLVSVFLTKILYLPFTRVLVKTPVYQTVSDAITNQVNLTLPEVIPPEFMATLGIEDGLSTLSVSLMSILTYVLLFILIYIGLSLLIRLLDGIFKLPVLKFFNRFCGLLFNGIKGMALCYVLAVVLQFFRADIVGESKILSGLLGIVPGLAEMLF